ncbi:PKD domain-containing protein [Chloroflexota bacterium]
MIGFGKISEASKFKKAGLIIMAVLVLALGVLVVREHVWPPDKAHASTSTLTPLSGDEVFLNNKSIDKTVAVEEGDKIRTGTDSWALVTFEDGSTIELEPETEIEIQVLTETGISVFQSVGQTWSGVQKLASGPVSDFEINTPTAGAIVRGTLIDTFVEEISTNIYDTLIAAFEGTVWVTGIDGIQQIIEAGMQSLIKWNSSAEVPKPIPPPQNRLEFTIDGEAWALVVDDPQRSIGVVPPGIVINQIPRSSTTGAQAEPQFMVIPAPEEEGDHSYYIVLHGRDEVEDVDVTVTGYAEGEKVFTISEENIDINPYAKEGDDETKYVATLEVEIDADGMVASGDLGDFVLAKNHDDFELWPEGGPGKIDIKDWASIRADEIVGPQANFSASMKDGKICFTNLSTGDITGYSWDFGDGKTSTDTSPSHTYIEGEYNVSLTVTGITEEVDPENILTDTARITIYIFTLP